MRLLPAHTKFPSPGIPSKTLVSASLPQGLSRLPPIRLHLSHAPTQKHMSYVHRTDAHACSQDVSSCQVGNASVLVGVLGCSA